MYFGLNCIFGFQDYYMKFLLAAFLATGFIITASSCKKCYNCVNPGSSTYQYCAKDYNSAQLNLLENGCAQAGGTWETASW